MLQNMMHESKRDDNYHGYASKGYKDNSSLFLKDTNHPENAQQQRDNYEDKYNQYGDNGLRKRHNRSLGSHNDLARISTGGNVSHHPLLPSQNILNGTHGVYQPGFFDPRHIQNLYVQGQAVSGLLNGQQHIRQNRNQARERDATLLHHLGRMSPEEQLNKFLKSVEREQELRQMTGADGEIPEEKSPRERRRRRQLLRRMTDGLHSRQQSKSRNASKERNTVEDNNEYAVIDKKKTVDSRRDSASNRIDPVRWKSVNGINDPTHMNNDGYRTNGSNMSPSKDTNDNISSDTRMMTESYYNNKTNAYKKDIGKTKSIAHRGRNRERTDAPKSFSSMSQLDNLLAGKSPENDSDYDERYEDPLLYLKNRENVPEIKRTVSNHYTRGTTINESKNTESGMMNGKQSAENRLSGSKDGKHTWNERKRMSLSMLKAKFNHRGKSSDIFTSDQSTHSHSPASLNQKDILESQRNKSISPVENMSIGSDDMMKSVVQPSNNAREYHRQNTHKNSDKVFIDSDVENHENECNSRTDGTDFSCSCTDVTLDEKYKITHRHPPRQVSSDYSNTKYEIEKKYIYEEDDIKTSDIIGGKIDNAQTAIDKMQLNESGEHIDGSRSLDNITAGHTINQNETLVEPQPFLSLNDSTTATKVMFVRFGGCLWIIVQFKYNSYQICFILAGGIPWVSSP